MHHNKNRTKLSIMVNPSASSPRRLLELEQDSSPFTLPVTVISVCAIWARNGFTRLMAALAARPAILPLFGRLLGAGGEARFDVRLRGFAVEVLAGFLVVAAGDAAMRPQLMAMVADPAVRRSLRAVASLHWPWAQDAAVCVWTYALRAAAADATDAAAAGRDSQLAAALAYEMVDALSFDSVVHGYGDTDGHSGLGAKAAAVVLGTAASDLPLKNFVPLVESLVRLLVEDPSTPRASMEGGAAGTPAGKVAGDSDGGVGGVAPLRGSGALVAGVLADLCASTPEARRAVLPLVVAVASGQRPEVLDVAGSAGAPVPPAAQRLAVQILFKASSKAEAREDLLASGAVAALLTLIDDHESIPEAAGLAACVCLHLTRHPDCLRALIKGGAGAKLKSLMVNPVTASVAVKAWPPWVCAAATKLAKAVAAGVGASESYRVAAPCQAPETPRSRMYGIDPKALGSIPGILAVPLGGVARSCTVVGARGIQTRSGPF